MSERPLRVAVIGASGRGDYGHGLDTAFADVPGTRLVAVADHDPAGAARAAKRIGVSQHYRDYRRMISSERPDIVCVAPRWLTQRVEMIETAAAAGCHVYCEKPLTRDVHECRIITEAAAKAKVQTPVSYTHLTLPTILLV